MTACDRVQRAFSERLDGGVGATLAEPAVQAHLERCEDCRAFVGGSESIRRRLRVQPVGPVPDVSASVGERLHAASGRRRRSPVVTSAAAFLAGLVVTAALLGVGSRGTPVAGASIPERILSAQGGIDTLRASLTVHEFGWHPDVPERVFTGNVTYGAPERLALHLLDQTTYPNERWRENDLDVVVGEPSWSRGLRACPVPALPSCTPDHPRLHQVLDREPFDPSFTVPLDLVVPVRSFRSAAPPRMLDEGEIDGRDAVAVEISAAQAKPLLDAFSTTGNLREVHAADRVVLWLDTDLLVPLRLTVFADDSDVRSRWALARGYGDQPGAAILEITWTDVVIDGPLPTGAFRVPAAGDGWHTVDGGFEDGAAVDWVPVPRTLPAGLTPHRAGAIQTGSGPIGVRTWSDGRSWVKVRATTSWHRERLFGGLGVGIRPIALPGGAGAGYLDTANNAVAVHAHGIDLVVTGSIDIDVLVDLAAGLGIEGRLVPGDWAEATAADLAGAVAALDGLELPTAVEGFAEPGFRIEDEFVTAVYSGPGARSFVLTQGPGERLSPPLDNDVTAITVAGTSGRWSPGRGELEWASRGRVHSLRSTTVSVHELLEIAASLEDA